MEIRKINIEKLLSGGERFDLFDYTGNDIEDIYPLPLVYRNEAVWGFCLLRAAEKRGIKELWCRFYASDTGAAENKDAVKAQLKAALSCEGRKENYTWKEKERIFLFMKENSIDPQDAEISDLIQGGGGSSFYQSVSAYSALPPWLKDYVNSGLVDLKTAKSCVNVPGECLINAGTYFETLSFSRRRILLVNISEILKREAFAAASGTAAGTAAGAVGSTGSGAAPASDIVTGLFRNIDPFAAAEESRYPELKSVQKSFDNYKNRMLKGSGIRLDSPPFFEGEGYRVEFTFKGRSGLKKIIDRLKQVEESSDDLFRLL